MNLLSYIPPSVTRFAGRTALYAQKYAPEILMGAGIVTGIAATVFACKATLKVDEVKCKTAENFIKIGNRRYQAENGLLEEGQTYTAEDAKRDTVVAYFQGAWGLAKLYAPAIGLGVLSIGMLTQSNRILNKRNSTLLAAYNALSLTFDQYKEKVEKDFNVDPVLVTDEVVGEEDVTEVKADGTVENKKKAVVRKKVLSEYALFWDRNTSKYWQNSRTYNDFFLKSVQQELNDRLKSQGHLFLNEVFDALGLERTQTGVLVGWLYGYRRDDGVLRDEYIDFGWDHPRNAVEPLKDPNPPYILDFNVDGQINELLP